MTASIPVIGLSTTDFVPGVYLQVNFAAGASAGTSNPISILLMGNALASSPCVTSGLTDGYIFGPDVEGLTVATSSDVINMFGSGSELHRMFMRVASVNKGTTPIYFVAVSESSGSAAVGTSTFGGTATATGYVRAYIGDSFVDTAISVGDGYVAVAANVAASISSLLTLPVTASPALGVLTLTAKQKGPRGNSIRFAIKVVGKGVGITSSAQNFANLSSGSTVDTWTNALATISPHRFTYIVSPGEDATVSGDLGELVAQVVSNALPIPGIRQRVFAGNTSSLGTAGAFAKALNTPLCDVIWQQNSNLTPGELAAYTAGAVAYLESAAIPTLNFDYLGTTPQTAPFWQISAPFDGTAPTRTTIKSALIDGLSPVQTLSNGASTLVSLITTYSQDPVSGNLDTRVRDHSIVTIMFLAADLIQSTLSQSYANKQAAADPPAGQKPPTSQVVTPSRVRTTVNKVLLRMADNGLLQDIADTMAATQVVLNTPSQFGILLQLLPIANAHQFAVVLNQLS